MSDLTLFDQDWCAPKGTPRPALDTDALKTMSRFHDMDTATGAAVIALHSRAEHKARVLGNLYAAGERGLTDFEHPGIGQTTAGKRRLDLQREGLVRRCADELGQPARRLAPSGVPVSVWCLTAAGYMAHETRLP